MTTTTSPRPFLDEIKNTKKDDLQHINVNEKSTLPTKTGKNEFFLKIFKGLKSKITVGNVGGKLMTFFLYLLLIFSHWIACLTKLGAPFCSFSFFSESGGSSFPLFRKAGLWMFLFGQFSANAWRGK